MKSPFELDLLVSAHREHLLAEASAQRLIDSLRVSRTPPAHRVRHQVAMLLYHLADRLSPDLAAARSMAAEPLDRAGALLLHGAVGLGPLAGQRKHGPSAGI